MFPRVLIRDTLIYTFLIDSIMHHELYYRQKYYNATILGINMKYENHIETNQSFNMNNHFQ